MRLNKIFCLRKKLSPFIVKKCQNVLVNIYKISMLPQCTKVLHYISSLCLEPIEWLQDKFPNYL